MAAIQRSSATKFWLGVASKNHVSIGVSQGFAQVNHGRKGPLMRMQSGDGLVYYSPGFILGEKPTLRAFTAIGIITDGLEQVEHSHDFQPWRRTITYRNDVGDAPVTNLKSRLHLTSTPYWGYQLRTGLVELTGDDYQMIEHYMVMAYNKGAT